jgi:menaquinol-cytochrome c reductase iron-sulfur subunit
MVSNVPPIDSGMLRRSFFGAILAAGSACIGAFFAIPLVRAALFPLRASDQSGGAPVWADLGPVEGFADAKAPATHLVNIERQDGWELTTVRQPVYILAGGSGQPRVVSSICPHLGCTVQWRADGNNFVCPCHNGTYAADGSRVSGPPKRGMDELPSKVQDGRLYVQFQYYRQLSPDKEVAD